MFHRHVYQQSNTDRNILYCTICGKVKTIPCNHEYKIIETRQRTETYSGNLYSYVYVKEGVKECVKCNKHTVEELII